LLGRLFDVDRFSSLLQSHRHSVFLDPTPQHSSCRPDRLLGSHRRQRRGGGVHPPSSSGSLSPSVLEPLVEAPVHLYQFAQSALFASRRFRWRSPLPHPAHSPSASIQRRSVSGVNLHPVLTSQDARCQRRPESFPHLSRVFPAYQPQHLQAKLLRSFPVGLLPTLRCRSLRALFPISPPEPLRLP